MAVTVGSVEVVLRLTVLTGTSALPKLNLGYGCLQSCQDSIGWHNGHLGVLQGRISATDFSHVLRICSLPQAL